MFSSFVRLLGFLNVGQSLVFSLIEQPTSWFVFQFSSQGFSVKLVKLTLSNTVRNSILSLDDFVPLFLLSTEPRVLLQAGTSLLIQLHSTIEVPFSHLSKRCNSLVCCMSICSIVVTLLRIYHF